MQTTVGARTAMQGDRRPRPEEKYLQKKLAELAEIESLLAQRELELHTLRGELLSFEKHYESAVGAKFAELDELRARIAELSGGSPAARGSESVPSAKTQAEAEAASREKARPRRREKTAGAKPAPTPTAP